MSKRAEQGLRARFGEGAIARHPVHGRFSRQRRLLKHADFDSVYRNGRRHFTAHMTVFYLATNEPGVGPRVGLTVGRALGTAVVRNRIKRRLREAVRASLEKLATPVDVVINPKKSVLTLDFSQLRAEVEAAFRTLNDKIARSQSRADRQADA